MNEYSREYSATGSCIILDTTALLAGIENILPPPLYTTSKAVEEVKDKENREKLSIAIGTGKISVIDPKKESISQAEKKAEKLKIKEKLSETDITIAALALELREKCKPIVFTDDYTLQYLLHKTGITHKPLRTKGIKTK
jgi:UPF0271 protein